MSNATKQEKNKGRICVYILSCSDGTLYTGWTSDLEKRVLTHNSGKGAKYTRSRLPVTPVYVEYQPSRSDALKREAAIKKLPRARKLSLIASAGNALRSR